MDLLSYKIVFFVDHDAEGSHVLKELCKKKYNLNSGNDENVMCDYISHKMNIFGKFLELKIYLVYDVKKFEKIRPLYFINDHLALVVFDIGKSTLAALEEIVQDLNLNNSKCTTVILGYRVNDEEIGPEIVDFICRIKGLYFEYSKTDDLEAVIDNLFENIDQVNQSVF